MDYLNIILLGIIEGITEFLPISSTGHLIIAEHWLGARSETFNVVIQAGAILAVVLIYWKDIVALLTEWRDPPTRSYLLKLIAAFVITGILGLIAKKAGFVLPTAITPVAWALVIGGFWMIGAEAVAARLPDRRAVSWKVAILVGLAQIVAGIFPGTSRSATTIFVAMVAGTSNRAAATEFAFLLAIPTMFAASGYELYSQVKHGTAEFAWGELALGFAVSTLVAFIAVKWLLGYIRSHRFTAFAIYRILFGGVLLALVAAGVLN